MKRMTEIKTTEQATIPFVKAHACGNDFLRAMDEVALSGFSNFRTQGKTFHRVHHELDASRLGLLL